MATILLAGGEEVIRGAWGEILRREGDRWITELVRGASAELRLSSVDLRILMADLYEGLDV